MQESLQLNISLPQDDDSIEAISNVTVLSKFCADNSNPRINSEQSVEVWRKMFQLIGIKEAFDRNYSENYLQRELNNIEKDLQFKRDN